MTRHTTFAGTAQHSTRAPWTRRVGTLLAAALLALITWSVAVSWFDIDLFVGPDGAAQQIGAAQVVLVPLVAGAAAWALLAMLERRIHGRMIWRITGWTVLAISLLGPIGMATTGTVLAALLALHLVVGTTLLLGLGAGPRATREVR